MTTSYVPILRAKRGEFFALRDLSNDVRDAVTPLLEVQAMSDPGKKTLGDHLQGVADSVHDCWGPGRVVYVNDLESPEGEGNSTAHPLLGLFAALRKHELDVIPVTALRRTDAYQEAVRQLLDDEPRLCLRLHGVDFADLNSLRDDVNALLSKLEISPDSVDLLVDFGSLVVPQTDLIVQVLAAAINGLPRVMEWRIVTLAMTSFPEQMSRHVDTGDQQRVPRTGWKVWQRLAEQDLPREPGYGDYAIDNPDTSLNIPPQILSKVMTASIRYTTDKAFLLIRGRNLNKYGYEQFHELCAILVSEPDYKGPEFSYGDDYIDKCSRKEVGNGNLTTWRHVGVNHHITLVATQLTNHLGT